MAILWDAGALAIVLVALVDGIPILTNLLGAFRYPKNDHKFKQKVNSCVSFSVISTEASKFQEMIHNPAFQALLQLIYLPSGDTFIFPF